MGIFNERYIKYRGNGNMMLLRDYYYDMVTFIIDIWINTKDKREWLYKEGTILHETLHDYEMYFYHTILLLKEYKIIFKYN